MEITPGTGGTLKTTTYEQQLFELAAFCAIAQRDTAKNPNGRDYFRIQIEDFGATARIEFEFPLEKTQTTNGFEFTGTEYLTGSGFAPGTGGSIEISSTLGYFYKLLIVAQQNEAPLADTNVDRISGVHDTNNHIISGSINFDATQQISASGTLCTGIVPYIPDPTNT